MMPEKGSKDTTPTSVSADEQGNVYAAGHYAKTLTLDNAGEAIVLPENIGESGGKGLTNVYLVNV